MVLHLDRPKVESRRPFRRSLLRGEGRVVGGLGRLTVVEFVRSGQISYHHDCGLIFFLQLETDIPICCAFKPQHSSAELLLLVLLVAAV